MWCFAELALGLMPALLVAPMPAEQGPTGEPHPQVAVLRAHVVELAGTVVDVDGATQVTTGSRSIDAVLDANLLFAKDSATLLPATRSRLATLAAQLRQAGPGSLHVTGYTDDLGSQQHGLVLSRQRAEAVRATLGPLPGVTVTVVGRGEAEPRVPNSDEAHRALNRRVELHFRAR